MTITEKAHWVNGYQIRGGWFKTFTFLIFNLGVLIYWGSKPNNQGFIKGLQFYKLI